ncbi:MAG TPA: DUF1549 domain-containing protein [Blastocatellia bacterium]|nr:DUF1549 domain-containing protein [Blastocatellia bacterium]
MSIRDGRKTSGRTGLTGRVKRFVVLTFVVAGVIAALDLSGFQTSSLAARGGRQQRTRGAGRTAVREVPRVSQTTATRQPDKGTVQVISQESLDNDSEEPPTVTSDDCTFLKDPESVRGLQARHRTTVSRTTVEVSERVSQSAESADENSGPYALRLHQALEIPRKNFIDTILFDRMARDGVLSAPLCSDTEFIRRVTLDLTGRIPSPEALTSFLNDPNPAKRDTLVDSLIASPEFVDKWTMFFGDLYKNTSNSTNITRYRGGRDAFYTYIKNSLANNKSYAQMATEIITATGDSFVNGEVNFIVGGFVPMGPIQDVYDGYAVAVSTTFLGLSSMDCLLCHNGAGHLDAVNLWGARRSRAEAWGMAAFFARTNRTFQQTTGTNYGRHTVTEAATGDYRLNTNSGNRQPRTPINGVSIVAPKYMFGDGGVNSGENRRQAIARLIVADPQFARATVNYLWEALMIEALVSPSNTFDPDRLSPNAQMPDGWALQPANAELLEALSQEFSRDSFNIRDLIASIAKSSAYQLSSRYPGTWQIGYVPYYARKFARRLSAEELHDAIVTATGQPPTTTFNSVVYRGYPITDDANALVRTVEWAMQLPEPTEPRTNGGSTTFLNAFLRGNRDSNLRQQEASILQALSLMNNNFVMGRIHQGNRITNIPNTAEIPSTVRRLLSDTSLTNDQLITQLYLITLSRQPSDVEKTKLLPYFTSMGRQAATESLQWVLLNKVDFTYNY